MGVVVLAMVLLGCSKKKAGEACERGKCADGLICDGPAPVVCRTCQDSQRCERDGLCEYRDGSCWARGEADCKASSHCQRMGYCTFAPKDGTCVNERGVTHWDDADNKEGGCPCGCDHSEDMLASLAAEPTPEALEQTRRSLHVIGERERAGYITDAMVAHRLRLRALERRLAPEGPFVALAPLLTGTARHDQIAPVLVSEGLRLRSELLLFGATTERVNGRDKSLPACFHLWLGLDNDASEDQRLSLPSLRAAEVGLEVRRWYLAGSDGEPWDGRLPAGARREVLVIGDLDQPLAPGRPVTVTVTLGSWTRELPVTTLGRWDEAVSR